MNPKAFISHASEDKDRFVESFAERLVSKGIDAWLDKWEMRPGDKLVDKIFNSGLGPSDAIIVVLSVFSVQKPWVLKELNTAVVKNIEDKTRLIPVCLDGCTVPECLRDIYRVTIRDLNSYDGEFDRIASAIHGQYDKPPLGALPTYTEPDVLQLDDLCRNDSLFLEEACRIAIEQGHPAILQPEMLEATLTEKGMPKQDILDAQEILADRFYIETFRETPWTMGPPQLYAFAVQTEGFRLFAEAGGVPEYDRKITDVARFLVEEIDEGGVVDNTSVESGLKLPPMLVEHIFERLRNNGLIEYSTTKGG
ncbi:MAG TPA: toll/interleukin-1 receptor domain-containing protein, partial [Bryobacteraceae bacterium]|nr:toll/interleukin-1 receptor domain-containing protein [Bryobacteraceae bacterium]